MVSRKPKARDLRLAHDAAFEIEVMIRGRESCGAIQPQAAEIEIPARTDRQSFDPIVARQTPARPLEVKLPGSRR